MNNDNSILLIDPTFDPADAPVCNLLVKVGLDSFSYAIINNKIDKVIAVFNTQECEDGTATLIECLKNHSYLTLRYQEVKVAAYTPNTISIPNELYEEENLALNAQYFTAPHTANLYTHQQPNFGFTTIFGWSKTTDDALKFTDGKKYHENAGLLKISETISGDSLVLDFTVNSFTTLYRVNNQIVFQQCYQIDNAAEFNYYLLLMIKQLAINTNTKIYLAGIVHKADKIYNCIEKYFTDITFLTLSNNLDQQILDDMPAHYYSSLLAINQCV